MEYSNIDIEFMERTLKIIEQYDTLELPLDEKFEITLLTNCLLGLIVFPREKTISKIPTERLTSELKARIGLSKSYINSRYTNMRDLIQGLRISVAHFKIDYTSNHKNIDRLIFYNDRSTEKIAEFTQDELILFIKYYIYQTIDNIRQLPS